MSDRELYDARYAVGYMDSWPAWKTERVEWLVGQLSLPSRGVALDWGCGAGVFTQVLARALPGWRVVGADVSPVALRQAAARLPSCELREVGDLQREGATYDLIFTHHVLEHVTDVAAAWRDMAALCAPGGLMLHSLPCGDPGSFEQRLCALRDDGIDPSRDDCFFFEEPGHLRRLRTSQMDALAAEHGFERLRAWYANHLLGALDWITAAQPSYVRSLTTLRRARGARAGVKLAALRALLLPAAVLRSVRHRPRIGRLVGPVERGFLALNEREWRTRRDEPGGSEMHLVYRRCPPGD